NVSVPVVLHLLATLPSLRHGLVMVQKEVADRLTAAPGSKVYGVPSVKLAWYANARAAGRVPPAVFWPVPNVDSGLVAFTRRTEALAAVPRGAVFAVVDAAFAQRRKTLRAALAGWAGSPARAEEILRAGGGGPGGPRRHGARPASTRGPAARRSTSPPSPASPLQHPGWPTRVGASPGM